MSQNHHGAMMLSRASLRLRLAGTLGLLFLAGMVVLYLAARSYSTIAADRSYDRLLVGSALSIGETLSASGEDISVDIPYAALDMLSAAPDDKVFYRVADPDNETVTGYDDLPLPHDISPQDLVDQDVYMFEAPYREEEVRFVFLPRQVVWNGAIHTAVVQVGQTGRARRGLARDLLVRSLVPIAIMTVLALAVVWFGIRVALRPLSQLSDELLRRQPQELGPLVGPVPTEIVPLVEALNGFMRRLNENIVALRTFIADAAHQIRTPLASLSAQAQLASSETGDELSSSLATINRNAAKLTRLVNQLLSDATIQHRADVRRFEPFDLLDTILKAVKEVVPQSEDSDVRVKTSLSSAPYQGDPVMIGEAIKNLLHNALIHGNAGDGEVVIELADWGAEFEIAVRDRGPGIPVDKQAGVFERFVRGDGRAPGAGLGLAIVQQSVITHGGRMALQNRADGGLEVTINLLKVHS